MKKIICFIICFNFLFFNCAFALEETIQDEFVNNTLDKNLKIKQNVVEPVVDEFALKTLDSDLKINKQYVSAEQDDLIRYLDSSLEIKRYDSEIKFDSDISSNKIKIKPVKYYTTKSNLHEGDFADFVLYEDFKMGDRIFKKGTLINARVENIVQNGIWGAPAEAVVGNFRIDKYLLGGQINKRGADRTLWVYPCTYGLCWVFGLGLLFIPIRGGHVKFKPNKIYEIEI